MSTRGGELIAADEPAVVSKPLLDPVVVENGQGNGCLPDSSGTDESDRNEVFGEIDDLLDQFVASKEGPLWRRWEFSRWARCKREMLDRSVVEDTDLA